MGRASRYSPEVRERAVRLVLEHEREHDSQWAAIRSIAAKIGCSSETLRHWVWAVERDTGLRPGLTTDERERLKALARENRELKRANEIAHWKCCSFLLPFDNFGQCLLRTSFPLTSRDAPKPATIPRETQPGGNVPELPEVERGRRLAEAVAAGRRIEAVACADDPIVFAGAEPEEWRRALEGKRVVAARRWGKQLWLELDAPPHPLFHFGMAGGFKTPASVPLQLKSGPRENASVWPPRFLKIRLRFDDGGELAMTDGRRLGRVLLRQNPEQEPPVSKLGFDPLLAMPTPARFSALIRARGSIVKSLLLDQSFAAGVGNWIADEALFQAGIDPRRRASSLTEAEARRLRTRLRSIVKRAVDANADDARYPRTWLFHRRWGKRDDARTARGESIEHLTIGGRTTAWVPLRQT